MTRVLVVEDERDLALGLRANLEVEGYDVIVAHTGEEGIAAAVDRDPDVIVLDLMLPGIDGYEVLATLRARGIAVPVLILSARAEEVDKVRGFRAGADDYVTKPFGVMELLMRIQVLLRRGAPPPTARRLRRHEPRPVDDAQVIRVGTIDVDLSRRVVCRNGDEIPLTPKELELLVKLDQRRDIVVSRHELLRDVWGYEAGVTTRTVDTHIAELRRKVEEDAANPQYILTVWKVGYRLRA